MTEAQIKAMVDRFLTWKLPADFAPDGGVTFTPEFNTHTAHPGRREPFGTNLLNAVQAEAMVRHMLADAPEAPAIPASDGSQRLSDHFTLAELTFSAAAARKGLDNTPPPEIVDQLILTADRMEKVRELLGGHPIRVTSGYRSPAVNKAVGGSATSAHRTGHAVDFTCPGFGTPAQVAAHLAKHLTGFDQIIEEFGQWVHVGFGPGQRGQKLTARKVGGKTKYTPGIKG